MLEPHGLYLPFTEKARKCFFLKTVNSLHLSFTFFQQQKKTKKCRAYSKKPENQTFFLKTLNSLRSNSKVFLTKKTLIFLMAFSLGEGKHFSIYFCIKHQYPTKPNANLFLPDIVKNNKEVFVYSEIGSMFTENML